MPASHVSRGPSLSLAHWRPAVLALLVAASLGLVACGKKDAPAAGGAGGAGNGAAAKAPPPPEVGVVTAKVGEVGLVNELPGRLEASRIAQVRARAAGIVLRRVFTEGSDVKAGQLLYKIDAAPYAATERSAQASLARAQANAVQAKSLAERYKPLVDANAVSKQEYQNAVAAQKTAEADVAVANASLQTARINLGYADVTAPISGRIGRALVTEGALVGQGDATALAVIQQIDPIYVNFTQSSTEVLRLRRALEAGQLKRASGPDAASVRLVLEDGTEYPQPGRLLFSDLTVDQSTGQVTLRAEVPNPGGMLLPGLYVRVRIEQAQVQNAITVPQQAVTRTQQGDTLLVVSPEGKVAPRQVKISAARDNRWIVLSGLKEGEQVVVDGVQKLQMMPPGATVKAVPWTPPSEARPAPAAGGAPAQQQQQQPGAQQSPATTSQAAQPKPADGAKQ